MLSAGRLRHCREAKDYVLLFSVANNVRSKDAALEQVNTALVHGVPGYILVSQLRKPSLSVMCVGHAHQCTAGLRYDISKAARQASQWNEAPER